MMRKLTDQPSERDADVGIFISCTVISKQSLQLTHAKATKAEFAKDYDQAFRLYIKSAETFLHLSRSGAITDKKKQQWQGNAAKALERAELIKKFIDASRHATTATSAQSALPSLNLTPIRIDMFSQRKL